MRWSRRSALVMAAVAAILTSFGLAATAPRARADTDVAIPLLSALHAAAGCPSKSSSFRLWCLAADGWSSGSAAPITPGNHALLGLTIELEEGKSVAEALGGKVGLSALSLRSDGTTVKARIATITPSNEDENAVIAEAIFDLAKLLKGDAPRAIVDKDLWDYVSSLPDQATAIATRSGHGWSFRGASSAELRQSGDVWLAIERPLHGPHGIWVSIFSDRIAAK